MLVFVHMVLDQHHTLVTSLVGSGRSVSILFLIDNEEKVSHKLFKVLPVILL